MQQHDTKCEANSLWFGQMALQRAQHFEAFRELNVYELHSKFGTTGFHKMHSSPKIIRSQGSSVGIMDRLQAVQLRSWGAIPAICKRLQPFPHELDWLWSPTRILFSGYWWYCSQDIKVANLMCG